MLPFNVELSGEQIDRDLPVKLQAEAEGILAWIVEGAKRWYTEGLARPDAVSRASEDWREEMDIVALFLAERCNADRDDPDVWAAKNLLYDSYTAWCDARTDRRRLERSSFFEYLTNRGFKEGKAERGTIRCIRGITLRSTPRVEAA